MAITIGTQPDSKEITALLVKGGMVKEASYLSVGEEP